MYEYERHMRNRAKQIAHSINDSVAKWLQGAYVRRFMLIVYIDTEKMHFNIVVGGVGDERLNFDVYAHGLVCTRDLQDVVAEELRLVLQRNGWEAKSGEASTGMSLNRPHSRLRQLYDKFKVWLGSKTDVRELPHFTVFECTLTAIVQQDEAGSRIIQFPKSPH